MTSESRSAVEHMSEDHRFVVDRTGRRFAQSHPRVVHVFPYLTNDFMSSMFAQVYERHGMTFRTGGRVTPEVLLEARKLCSGRECLAFTAIAGATHRDMTEHRSGDEISIYHGLEQEGPCQCGAWPLVWQTFARRLGLENAVFPGHATLRNNYLGHGTVFGTELMSAIVAADVLDEAKNALSCLARDVRSARAAFEEEARAVVESARHGVFAMIVALGRWSRSVAKIPLRASIREVPKVLVFGGGVLSMIHKPIVEFFSEQGIAAKVADFSEFILYLESEFVMRSGFMAGRQDPASQFSWPRVLGAAILPWVNGREARRGLYSRFIVQGGSVLVALYKKIARASGLNYDRYIAFQDIVQQGNKYIPFNTYCEAIAAVGRFICSAASGIYDGFVHVATFNCQPSLDAQAVVRKLANERDVALAAVDVEAPRLTPNQVRLLENMVVQAKRRRAAGRDVS